ncbi:MAG: hypothetical protein AAF206_30100 [Bacteroidota bacterium]
MFFNRSIPALLLIAMLLAACQPGIGLEPRTEKITASPDQLANVQSEPTVLNSLGGDQPICTATGKVNFRGSSGGVRVQVFKNGSFFTDYTVTSNGGTFNFSIEMGSTYSFVLSTINGSPNARITFRVGTGADPDLVFNFTGPGIHSTPTPSTIDFNCAQCNIVGQLDWLPGKVNSYDVEIRYKNNLVQTIQNIQNGGSFTYLVWDEGEYNFSLLPSGTTGDPELDFQVGPSGGINYFFNDIGVGTYITGYQKMYCP